jgi:transposase-like protein
MSDRFYTQQLAATGSCPGFKSTTKRRRKVAWTDEKREEAVSMYLARNPTAENSMEIVKEIAEELDESPNGVRAIIAKAGVYVKISPAAKTGTKAASTGTGRVNKAAVQEALIAELNELGVEVDEEIISKMTGKAAAYFTEVLKKVNK